MDIKERLTENDQKLKTLQERVQLLQQELQSLLQELLRLDGERRLLNLLVQEQKNEKN